MARGKKKEELTLEEKLERALVPVEEQPYEVPENWCWVIFDNIASIKRGASPRPIKAYVTEEEGVNWIKIGDADSGKHINIVKEKITLEGANKSVYVKSGSLLLSNSMSFGHPYILNVDGCIHDGWLAITPSKVVDKDFLYYTLLASDWYFEQVAVGTAVRNLNSKRVANLPLAIPPLSEQKRIVEQIDSLFAKLDEAKEKVRAVLDGCEIRKASILRDVFNGKLSESWRAKNGVKSDSWNNIIFDDCIDKMQNGLAKRSGQEGKLFGVLRLANLEENSFNTDDLREIKLTKKEQDNYKLNVNDIVMIRVNGSRDNVGRQILVKEEHDWAFCDHIIRIILKKNIEPAFMVMFSETDEYRHYIEEHMVSSAGQNTISRKGLAELCIPVPTIDEQLYLIQTVNGMTQKDIIIKENTKDVQEKIDLMKKSILAKAFRGELGTNNSEEESAIELLKVILTGT